MDRLSPFDARAETRAILALAWPVVLTSLNWTILQVTDIVVVGLVSTEQAAILGVSRTLTLVTFVAGLAWLSGVLVHSARASGAGDPARAGAVLREGVALALLLGAVITTVLLTFTEPLLVGLGVAPALIAPGALATRVMTLALPFQLVSIATSFFLEGVSRPRRVAAVNLSILPLNAVLAWALSGGHLGSPVLGAVGAASATVIASALGAAGMLLSAFALPQAKTARPTRRAIVRGAVALAGFGLVPAIASGLELAGFSILIALSTRLGDAAAHAFQIVFSVHNVTFAVALGLGSAAGVRAGNAVGEGRATAARARVGIALLLTTASLGLVTVLLIAGADTLVALFPAGVEAHRVATAMLPAWAPFIVFDGVQVVLLYALRSLGDQVVAGINGILAYFVVTGGVGWWLVGAGVGPIALVWASGAGMVAAALLNGARFVVIDRRLRRAA